ncbi:hypothetical protein GCM10027168_65990 [Streptomyces capparidis]
MSALNWQKSSYSVELANCINVATTPQGTIALRESDDPDVIVTVSPDAFGGLIQSLKAGLGPV